MIEHYVPQEIPMGFPCPLRCGQQKVVLLRRVRNDYVVECLLDGTFSISDDELEEFLEEEGLLAVSE